MNIPKVISFEGVDGCGKATQVDMLFDWFQSQGIKVKKFSFPNYDNTSSTFVKMYLNGNLGNLNEVSATQASLFYALDRFVTSRKEKFHQLIDEGYTLIMDRYVESNIYHQLAKLPEVTLPELTPQELKILDFIQMVEYGPDYLNLPKPDMTFYLKISEDNCLYHINQRANKIDGSQTKDIHESNSVYMKQSITAINKYANILNMITINCEYDCGVMKTREEISASIIRKIQSYR